MRAMKLILEAVKHAEEKHGKLTDDPAKQLAILTEEYLETLQSFNDGKMTDFYHELTQTVSVGIRMLNSIYGTSDTEYEICRDQCSLYKTSFMCDCGAVTIVCDYYEEPADVEDILNCENHKTLNEIATKEDAAELQRKEE